jgi:hypothetical protein
MSSKFMTGISPSRRQDTKVHQERLIQPTDDAGSRMHMPPLPFLGAFLVFWCLGGSAIFHRP